MWEKDGTHLTEEGSTELGHRIAHVLEPWLIGDATSLQPVALMLAILMWGSIWGVTGMILAVPITAVMRIYLEHLDHPLPKYIAKILAGKGQGHAKPEPRDGAPAMV